MDFLPSGNPIYLDDLTQRGVFKLKIEFENQAPHSRVDIVDFSVKFCVKPEEEKGTEQIIYNL